MMLRARFSSLCLAVVLGGLAPAQAPAAPSPTGKTTTTNKARSPSGARKAGTTRRTRPARVRGSRAAAPRAATRSKRNAINLQRPGGGERHDKALASTLHEGTALVTAALLNYADGKHTSADDAAIKSALDAVPGGRSTARRIAARIRAQPPKVVGGFTGRHSKRVSGPTTVASLGTTVRRAKKRGYLSANNPMHSFAITLPAEDAAQPPSTLDLRLSGVFAYAAEDPDGTDELVVLVKTVREPSNSMNLKFDQEVEVPNTLSVTPGQPVPTPLSVSLSTGHDHVVLSAVAEADGDAAAKRQELELAMELALAIAVSMGDSSDPAGALIAVTEYAESMLSFSHPLAKASIEARRVDSSQLASWWSATSNDLAGIPWKTAVQHELDSGGSHLLLYDLPSTTAQGRMVMATVKDVSTPESVGLGRLKLVVGINGEQAVADLPLGSNSVSTATRVRRHVGSGMVRLRIGVELNAVDLNPTSVINTVGVGASENTTPHFLDVAPGTRTLLYVDYNPETGELLHSTGTPSGGPDAKGYYTFSGTGDSRARLKLRVSAGRL